MESLGETLRQAREARALTLEEVERQTRIRVKFLRALESDDFSVFPSDIHAKGFLRNYAQFLGLNAEALVTQYGDLTDSLVEVVTIGTAPPTPQPVAPSISARSSRTPPSTTYIPPDRRVGPAVPTSLGAARAVTPVEPDLPASPFARLLRSNLFVMVVLGVGLIAVVLWASIQLRNAPARRTAEGQSSGFLEEMAALNTPVSSPTFLPTSTPEPQVGPDFFNRVVLTIQVEQRSWTRIEVDDTIVFEGQAEPDTILQYEGQEFVRVLAGNGAGLDVTYNGTNIGPLGQRGEVVERLFTVEGWATMTPTPSPTPTDTPVPTATPSRTPTPTR